MSIVKNSPVQGRSADLHLRSPSPIDEHCYKHQIISSAFTQIELDYCFSVARSCLTLCDSMDRSRPGFPVLHYFPEFAQTHVHWVGDAIQPSHPVVPFSSYPQPFAAWRYFSSESALHIRWPEYWSFSFNISPCNEYSGLISFRMDWFDSLTIRGTKSWPHSSPAESKCLRNEALESTFFTGFWDDSVAASATTVVGKCSGTSTVSPAKCVSPWPRPNRRSSGQSWNVPSVRKLPTPRQHSPQLKSSRDFPSCWHEILVPVTRLRDPASTPRAP